METVIVARVILKEEWCRPALAGTVAPLDECLVPIRVSDGDLHRIVPSVGCRHQVGVQRGPQTANDTRKRIAEVLVLTLPEAVTRHDDAGTKKRIVRIHPRHGLTLVDVEQRFEPGTAS
jgi:hypothetical protein